MSDQLILKFPSHQAYKKEDFYVSPSNQEAYDLIECWPKWIKRTVNIFGPPGSGKSHLVSILKNKTSSLQVESYNLKEDCFLKFKTKEALIIENVDEKVSERLLFSLWNTALQDNKYLLITSKKPINLFQFKLKDLLSRVKSSLVIGINLPSDDLITVILAKNFSDKQIKIEKKHIDYIIKRIDRSYEKISQFILTLDKYSLKKGSPFALKMIKEVLKMI
jgi:chromosomal replication initiation ATPase DnaA|tara:strand:- start:695 stop:1354 length:660 start_codon:yes stop_codon:yes gene_type:complete